MTTEIFIALFRGINVGGHNRAPMAELRGMLGELGLEGVRTYVQSGNAVFRAPDTTAPDVARRIEEAFAAGFGFPSRVLVLGVDDWAALIGRNPFPEIAGEPTKLHLFVLEREPDPENLRALQEKATRLSGEQAQDRFVLRDKALYLHAPNGIGRSKLAELIGRTLKVDMTARNWRTVLALKEMAEELRVSTGRN